MSERTEPLDPDFLWFRQHPGRFYRFREILPKDIEQHELPEGSIPLSGKLGRQIYRVLVCREAEEGGKMFLRVYVLALSNARAADAFHGDDAFLRELATKILLAKVSGGVNARH